MIFQVIDPKYQKQKKITRGKLEHLYDILAIIRNQTEIQINVLCTYARTPDKNTRHLVDSCLDGGLLKIIRKENHRGKKTDFFYLTAQGHQFLAHFDKICFIAGYKPISERK